MEIISIASPAVALTTILVLILVLWMLHNLERRLRVLQDHFDSVQREVEQLDEGLQLLSTRGAESKQEAIDLPVPPAPEDEILDADLPGKADRS